MSDSLTRVAKKSQWETLEWLVTLADVNGSASSSIGRWNGTELMGRIRIKQSVADLSSHIVKTEHQVRCCILHGSLLSALMNGLITTISPPPFDLSANTLPSWVIAVAPDAIWPRDEVDFNDLQEDKEEEREGGKVEQKERGDRRERSAPQKSSKVKAK